MRVLIAGAAALGVVALAAGAYHLAGGQRYKLYLDDHAARCWSAILEVTFAPSATRFRRIDGPHRHADGRITTVIEFRSTNVFAGTRDTRGTCEFDARDASRGRLPARILIDDHELEPDVLEAVNAALAAD